MLGRLAAAIEQLELSSVRWARWDDFVPQRGSRRQHTMISQLMRAGGRHERYQPGNEIERLEVDCIDAVSPWPTELQAHPAVLGKAQPVVSQWRMEKIAAQTFQLSAVIP